MSARFVPAFHSTIASGRQPEGGNPRHSPLPSVTVSAQNQVNCMMRVDIVEDVRGMGQQENKAAVGRGGDTSEIGPMKRGIIDADDQQLSPVR